MWTAAWAIANGIFVLDLILELTDRTTISEWVWGHTPKSKRWTWYVGAVVGFNGLCLLVSGPVAMAFLGGWLMAHLQGAR